MAGIQVGSAVDSGGRRSVNQELPLIPFIDFLLCLVAFLLVTAVWSQMARLDINPRVPGDPTNLPPPSPARVLHVAMSGPKAFTLSWLEGSTVIRTLDVERKAINVGPTGDIRYPDLASAVTAEWQQHGSHRAPSDPKTDQAVVHSSNATPFAELAAVLDALRTPRRNSLPAGDTQKPAFQVALAVD